MNNNYKQIPFWKGTRKIILGILFLFMQKQISIAQDTPFVSTLTQITTDLMTTENRSSIQWSNINLPTITTTAPRLPFICWFYCRVLGWERWCSEDVMNTGGNHPVFGGKCKQSGTTNISSNSEDGASGGAGGVYGGYGGFHVPPAIPNLQNTSIVGGSSGASTNPIVPPPTNPTDNPTGGSNNPPIKKDTVQPTQWVCDSAKIARGKLATEIISQLDSNSFEQTRLRDSAANSMNESGFQIFNDTTNVYTNGTFRTGGLSQNVSIPSATSAHTQIGGIHNHPDSGVNAPSPLDLFHLLLSKKVNSKYFVNFVIAHDETEWALMINDSATAMMFINDSAHNFGIVLDTSGPNKNGWSTVNINPKTGNFYNKDYNDYVDKLKNENYPLSMLEAYASIYMINKYFNTGAVLLQRVGSAFKELSVYDLDPNGKTINKIKICN